MFCPCSVNLAFYGREQHTSVFDPCTVNLASLYGREQHTSVLDQSETLMGTCGNRVGTLLRLVLALTLALFFVLFIRLLQLTLLFLLFIQFLHVFFQLLFLLLEMLMVLQCFTYKVILFSFLLSLTMLTILISSSQNLPCCRQTFNITSIPSSDV